MRLLHYTVAAILLVAIELPLAGCAERHQVTGPATGVAVQSGSEGRQGEPVKQADEHGLPAAKASPAKEKGVMTKVDESKAVAKASGLNRSVSMPSGKPPEPSIGIDELVERLKQTDAIGFLTKLTIRSDVLEFKSTVESYQKNGAFKKNLEMLRGRFDGLLLKILALLEDDPKLSRDIYTARDSIWKTLVEVKS